MTWINREVDDYQERFQALREFLDQNPPPSVQAQELSSAEIDNQSFFEAFCSNAAEGSTIDGEEAEQVIYEKGFRTDSEAKQKDAEDLVRTKSAISDPKLRATNPVGYGRWKKLLRQRHRHLMEHRPENRPGKFKKTVNKTNKHVFVQPASVKPLLRIGHDLSQQLSPGLARAALQYYVITAVHPFVDGNGRTARMVMNAELSLAGLERCLVTKRHRAAMIAGAMKLFRWHRPEELVSALVECQKWTASLSWGSRKEIWEVLDAEELLSE